MATEIVADAEKITHDNYNAAVGPVTKSLPARCSAVFIDNRDATDSVQVSFDGGVLFKDIGPGKALSMDVAFIASYVVKASANTPAVQCLYASERS